MITLLLVHSAVLVVLLGAAYAMPSFVRPTLQFGVRVPEGRTGDPVIGEQRRRYRIRLLALGVPLIVATVGLLLITGRPVVLPLSVLAVLGVHLWLYYRAHVAISAVKQREQWYAGLRQGVVVDTSLRTNPPRMPWAWVIPPLLVIAATLTVGVLRYPALPDRLTLHWGPGGQPDHTVATSIGSAFVPVLTQCGLSVLLIGVAALSLRLRPGLDAARPVASAHQHRRYVTSMAKGLLILLLGLNTGFFVTALSMWNSWAPQGWAALGLVAPGLLGVAAMLVITFRAGQEGHRLPAGASAEQSQTTQRDDDAFWRGGLIYLNPDDPAVFVPKRFGIGWTLNFGNRLSWITLAGTLLAAVAITLATRGTGRH